MTLYTSGSLNIDSEIALAAHYFITNKYPLLRKYDVEVHYCDLTEDNVFGWCERVDEDSWLIHIHNDLQIVEHYKTLFHEFTHIVQDIFGLSDNNAREYEASKLEQLYYDQFITTEAFKVSS